MELQQMLTLTGAKVSWSFTKYRRLCNNMFKNIEKCHIKTDCYINLKDGILVSDAITAIFLANVNLLVWRLLIFTHA
jgi:hypothetical protein